VSRAVGIGRRDVKKYRVNTHFSRFPGMTLDEYDERWPYISTPFDWRKSDRFLRPFQRCCAPSRTLPLVLTHISAEASQSSSPGKKVLGDGFYDTGLKF